MASSDSQIDKPQRGRPKRAELPDVKTGAQSINTERAATPLFLFTSGDAINSIARNKHKQIPTHQEE